MAPRTLSPDPLCRSTGRHRSVRAHREDHCICMGPAWVQWLEYQERRRTMRRPKAAAEYAAQKAERAKAQRAPKNPPPVFEATELDRRLWARTDLVCRDEDPAVFEVDGDERAVLVQRQIDAARAICGNCPAIALCAEAALQHGDAVTFQGGMSPDERHRERIRRGLVEDAA